MQDRSFIVIGGGVAGLTTALRLAETGCEVSVIDERAPRGAASWGNAGHIAVEQTAPLASPHTLSTVWRRLFLLNGALDLPLSGVAAWAPFAARFIAASGPATFERGERALRQWLALAMPAWARLANDIGAAGLLKQDGHFVVWESAKAAEKGVKAWAQNSAPTAAFRNATPTELSMLHSFIRTPIAAAIRFTQSGQIYDLPALRRALIEALGRSGGSARTGRAKSVERRNGHIEVSLETGERIKSDAVVITAGVRSRRLMEALGHKTPLIAERGYHIETPLHQRPDQPPIAFEDRSAIATWFADRARLASFVEFTSADAPPDPRKWRRLRSHAQDLGLPIEGEVREWMGARPTLPDYLPAVGASKNAPGVYYAFGHQHLGLTLAPITAEAVRALATGEQPPADLTPFDIERFGND